MQLLSRVRGISKKTFRDNLNSSNGSVLLRSSILFPRNILEYIKRHSEYRQTVLFFFFFFFFVLLFLSRKVAIMRKSFHNCPILEFDDDSNPRGEASHNSPLFTRTLIASKAGVYARTRDHIMFEII